MKPNKIINATSIPEKYSLSLFFFFLFAFAGSPLMYLPQFFKANGMNTTQLGYLMSAIPLFVIIGQFFWGNVADKSRKINNVLFGVIICSVISAAIFFFLKGFWAFLFGSALLYFFISSVAPLADTLIITRSVHAGLNFGKLRSLGTIGFLLASLIAGYLAQINRRSIFLLVIIFGIILFVVVLSTPAVPGMRKKGQKFDIWGFFKSKDIIFIFLLSMIMHLTYGFHFAYFPVYFSSDLKAGTFLYGILVVCAALFELPILLNIDRFVNKFPIKPALIITALMTAFRWMVYGISSNVFILIAFALLQGASIIGMHYFIVVYLSKRAPAEGRTTVIMILNIINYGVVRVVGSFFGSFAIKSLGGIQPLYLISAGLIVLSCLTFTIVKFKEN